MVTTNVASAFPSLRPEPMRRREVKVVGRDQEWIRE